MNMSAKIPAVARVLLGFVFVLFGLNGFLRFLPLPPHPGAAGAFLGALAATGYMFPLVKTTEVLAGALLLSGRLVPLALVLLAPVLVNIGLFHFVLEPRSSAMVVVLLALEGYLAWTHRASYAPLFRAPADAKARPLPAGQTQAA
jgi:putative oxidoreductase